MQYLVTAEWIELGALLSPEQVVGIIDQTVGPSLEMLAREDPAADLPGREGRGLGFRGRF